jgi:hypothetical protein
MRGKLARFMPECGFRRRTATSVLSGFGGVVDSKPLLPIWKAQAAHTNADVPLVAVDLDVLAQPCNNNKFRDLGNLPKR